MKFEILEILLILSLYAVIFLANFLKQFARRMPGWLNLMFGFAGIMVAVFAFENRSLIEAYAAVSLILFCATYRLS